MHFVGVTGAYDMRVVAGLDRQKSMSDSVAGAGGEPASRPMPPVLSQGNKNKTAMSTKVKIDQGM